MRLSGYLAIASLCLAQAHAAVTIFVEPGSSGTSVFTVTETAPNPLLAISGISGYVLGMELPTSMFNIPGLGTGSFTDIEGSLISTLATISEVFSGQSFALNRLKISSGAGPSLFYFDPIYLTDLSAAEARFEVVPLGPVISNIGFGALNPGVHSVISPIFGVVTVTIVPEPSTFGLMAATFVPLFSLRRRSRAIPSLSNPI